MNKSLSLFLKIINSNTDRCSSNVKPRSSLAVSHETYFPWRKKTLNLSEHETFGQAMFEEKCALFTSFGEKKNI